MTTVHLDKDGKHVRTDPGTQPAAVAAAQPFKPAAAPVDKTAPAASTTADASASASKEK